MQLKDKLPNMTEEEQLRLLATDGILVGEIVNVNADESILTDGKIDPKKLKPISYDPVNNTYLAMGDKVGNAFKDGLKLK